MELRLATVDLRTGAIAESRHAAGPGSGPVGWAIGLEPDTLLLGVGPLGELDIPGANRLVFAGHSPLWDGFFSSSVGSAGAALRHLALDLVELRGRATTPSALVLSREGRTLVARLHPVDAARVWTSGRPGGTYAMLDAVIGAGWTRHERPRALVTGPASASTRMGAIGSAIPRDGQPAVLETWAGRGGFGSRLFQHHGLCAILLDAPADAGRAPRPREAAVTASEIVSGTTKYRYHPLLATGGTLGSNLATLREKLLAFNDRSMYWPPEMRREIHEQWIEGRYLRQFNEQTGHGRRGRDCGETCPAVCKKVSQGLKKDYQPYAALGPHIGVFDQAAAEIAADTADALGFDAVEAGALVGWALDCLADGVLSPEALSLSDAPQWSVERFDPEADSFHNAHLAAHLLAAVAEADAPTPLVAAMRKGIRSAAHHADGRASDRASYSALGREGSMAPNHYWTPGIVAPIPLPGKYYTDYSLEFAPPRELGRRSAHRLVRELALDNLGMCRFQREWAEDRLPELLASRNEAVRRADVWPAHTEIARNIATRNVPTFWETTRTIDRVATYLDEVVRDDPGNSKAHDWKKQFAADKTGAARHYWDEFRAGLAEGLA